MGWQAVVAWGGIVLGGLGVAYCIAITIADWRAKWQ